MKNLQKSLLVLFCLFSLSIASGRCALACDSPGNYTCESAFGGLAEPFAEKTGYKYKIENGKMYKRLWSYTKKPMGMVKMGSGINLGRGIFKNTPSQIYIKGALPVISYS